MTLNLSQRQLNNFVINFVLFAVVVLSWVYAILAGKFISERHLKTLDFSNENDYLKGNDLSNNENSKSENMN